MLTSPIIPSVEYVNKRQRTTELDIMSDGEDDDVHVTQRKSTRVESWSTYFAREGRRMFPNNSRRIVDHERLFGVERSRLRRPAPRKFWAIMNNADIRRTIVNMLDDEAVRALVSNDMHVNCGWLWDMLVVQSKKNCWVGKQTPGDIKPIKLLSLVDVYDRWREGPESPIRDIKPIKLSFEANRWIVEHRSGKRALPTFHGPDWQGCNCTPARPCEMAAAYWTTFHKPEVSMCMRVHRAYMNDHREVVRQINTLYGDGHAKYKKMIEQASECEFMALHQDMEGLSTSDILEARVSSVKKYNLFDRYEHFNVHLFGDPKWEKNASDAQNALATRMPGAVLVGYGIRPVICGWRASVGVVRHMSLQCVLRRFVTYIRPCERDEGEEPRAAHRYYQIQSNSVWSLDGKVCYAQPDFSFINSL